MAYPGTLDDFTARTDGSDDVVAADINELQTAIEAIETELGTDPAGSLTDVKTRLIKSLDANGNIVLNDSTSLTISSGAITASQNFHRVDTQSAAASDDLTTINGGTDGFILVIRPTNDAHSVVVKNGTGNIITLAKADITLDDETDTLWLVYDGNLSKWLGQR